MSERKSSSSGVGSGCGTLIGAILAGFLSWEYNHSIGWAIWHFLLNWMYILYRAFMDWETVRDIFLKWLGA